MGERANKQSAFGTRIDGMTGNEIIGWREKRSALLCKCTRALEMDPDPDLQFAHSISMK